MTFSLGLLRLENSLVPSTAALAQLYCLGKVPLESRSLPLLDCRAFSRYRDSQSPQSLVIAI